MKCPGCGGKAKRIDGEYPCKGDPLLRKRRHECLDCGRRFNTYQEDFISEDGLMIKRVITYEAEGVEQKSPGHS